MNNVSNKKDHDYNDENDDDIRTTDDYDDG